MRYNLTSLRRREAVQPFFGRPITFLRFCETFTSCVPRPRLRILGVPVCEVVEEGIESGIESGVLKMEKSAVEGLTEADMASTPILGSLDTNSIERTASECVTRLDD